MPHNAQQKDYFLVIFFPNDNILDWSKQQVFAVDNIKFDENGRKIFKQVENTVGKGEIAHYEQLLLFPVFSEDLNCRHINTRACLGKDYMMACLMQNITKMH